MLWDIGEVALGTWVFFIRGMSQKVYNLIASIGGIGFVVVLIVLSIYGDKDE